jgi:hypothetical protein
LLNDLLKAPLVFFIAPGGHHSDFSLCFSDLKQVRRSPPLRGLQGGWRGVMSALVIDDDDLQMKESADKFRGAWPSQCYVLLCSGGYFKERRNITWLYKETRVGQRW